MKIPPLNTLKTFEVAARHENFSKAGNELCVTHAAVSHQIKNLEEWFGKQLFIRQNRRVRLSKSGQVLYGDLQPLFRELEYLCQKTKTSDQDNQLSVGCIPSIASRWLIPNLGEFAKLYPDITLQVLYAQADDQLSDHDYDILITMGEDTSDSVMSDRLFSRATRPVCSPAFLKDHPEVITPVGIAQSTLLHDETRKAWQQWFKQADLSANTPITGTIYQDMNLLFSAVIAGHGIALCPTDIYPDEIKRGDLVILSNIEANRDQNYYISSEREKSVPSQAFIAWFKELIRSSNKKPA